MRTMIDLTELAEQLPARRVGEVLRRVRWNAGLSRAEVAMATDDRMPIRLLGALERGRRRPTRGQIELLDQLYGANLADLAAHLGTARVGPAIDLSAGVIELGSHRVALLTNDSGHVLSQFVELVSAIRGTHPTELSFRVEDLNVLGTSLGRSRRSIKGDLRSLLRGELVIGTPPEAHADAEPEAQANTAIEAHADEAHAATQLAPLEFREPRTAPGDPRSINPLRLVELDAVRDAIYAPASLRDRLATKHTRTDRDRALRVRQRELLGELGYARWSSMLIAIARAEAAVPTHDTERMLALPAGT